MDKTTAREYIGANFRNDDRLAIVLIQKSTGAVTQRIADVDRITSDQFQAWLRHMNAQRHEVYVSMNALNPDARARTKADIAAVRHVYLDFDKDGPAALRSLRSREDLPIPNHIVQSSPGRFQVVWRVEGFSQDEAEDLMKALVQELGADPAATDSARVMRVPGLYNHKYGAPHFVSVENLSEVTHDKASFPEIRAHARAHTRGTGLPGKTTAEAGRTQSERDWCFALRALARGDDPAVVASAIAAYRQDKPNPQYYAEYTVEKAHRALESRTRQEELTITDPNR